MKVVKRSLFAVLILFIMVQFSYSAEESRSDSKETKAYSYSFYSASMCSLITGGVMARHLMKVAPGSAVENNVSFSKMIAVSVGIVAITGAAGGIAGYLIVLPVDYFFQE